MNRIAFALGTMFFSTTILGAVPAGVSAADRDLRAIALVESNLRHSAIGRLGERGAWQMTQATWNDTSHALRRLHVRAYRHTSAHDPNIGRLYASAHYDVVRRHLRAALERPPTIEEIYAAWNLGLSGFAQCGYRLQNCPAAVRERAQRVKNIVETLP